MPKPLTDEQLERRIARLGRTKEKADLLIELGRRLYFSRIDRAKALFDQALELATALKHRPAMAAAHQSLAGYYSRSDLWKQSLPHAEQALDLHRQIRDQEGEAVALRLIGESHITAGEYQRAEELLREALTLQLKRFDDDGAGYSYSSLGFLFWKTGHAEQSREAFQQARQMFVSSGNRRQQAYVTNNLAVIESDRGNYAQALTMLEELIPLREQLGDVSGLIETYSNIGNQYAMFADYETALEYMLKGLRLREDLNVGRSDYALSNIAFVYSKLGRLDEAERYYHQALSIAGERGDAMEICDYHSNLASVNLKLGRIDAAIEHASRAIDDARRLGSDIHAAGGFANLAAAYRHAGDYVQARDAIEQAVAITRGNDNRQHLEEHLRALATIRFDAGDVEGALAAASESLNLALESGRAVNLPEIYALLSDLHERRGDHVQALDMSRRRFESNSATHEQNITHKLQTLTVQFDVERLRRESEIARLNAERYSQELEMKKKELSLMALHLVNKNEFLMDLRQQISANVAATNEFIRELARRIEEGITSDRDWNEFEQHFTQTNPDFTARLIEQSDGKLSPTELKICALLRTGLSSKEIANVLMLSPRTVETHRYNIHKKLKLGAQKLVTYLMGMG